MTLLIILIVVIGALFSHVCNDNVKYMQELSDEIKKGLK